MENLLFCVNHPDKIAKRHCNKCVQDLCNDCALESHIEHHTEIKKIEYTMDLRQVNYPQIFSKEIKTIIEKSINDLKPQIYQLVLEKTEEYIKEHKNLQLKLNQVKDNKKSKNYNKSPTKPRVRFNEPESKDTLKKQIISKRSFSSIGERTQIFSAKYSHEITKKIDENNPYYKNKNQGKIKSLAKLFE